MISKLSNKGYVIKKDKHRPSQIKKIKKELNVSPYSPYNNPMVQPVKYPVYLESVSKLYLPRWWGLENLGPPEKFDIKPGFDIDLKFNGTLRPVQKEAKEAFMKNCFSDYGGGIICLGCGFGKCMAKDTPVIMYDGTIKMIQDVKIGDQLMGDDSTPRNVLNLGRGMEMMYDIVPTKGDTYTVNESHVLSLKCSTNQSKKFRKGEVYDISLKDYMNLPPSYHGRGGPLLGYRVGVDFPFKEVDIDPYFLGYWLGDGSSRNTGITTVEKCVVDYYENYAKKLDLHIRKSDSNGTRCPTYHASGNRGQGNILLKMLKKHNLICNKHIPHIYKCNSREIRLQVLAGILDSDGSNNQNSYDIIQKNEKLLDDIIYLARSLGFACYKKECEKTCVYKGENKTGTYYRTNIHGKGLEEIPVKCERKKVQPRRQIKDALTTRIKVVPKGVDYYYGVELDGNHRYLLGSFTVTHNTALSLNIIAELKKKALVIVHKEFLLNQWIDRIGSFLPGTEVGRIQAKTFDVAGKDIVIGMLQTLSQKDFPEDAFESFGTLVVDECFTGDTLIYTEFGLVKIEQLYSWWRDKSLIPKILSYNKELNTFEYKSLSYGWEKESNKLLELVISGVNMRCTENHKILCKSGYIEAKKLDVNSEIVMLNSKNTKGYGKLESIINLNEESLVYDIEVEDNHNFVVCNKDNGGVVVSNCHHISSETFSRALPKTAFKYTIGLTATPNRMDGLTKVFEWFLGPIVYKSKNRQGQSVFVKVLDYRNDDEDYCRAEVGFDGKLVNARMVNNVANCGARTKMIIEEIKKIMEEVGRKMLILSDRREHLKNMNDILVELGFDTGFYLGGMKQKDLDISETKPIILGTFSMSSEALDIPELNTLFMTCPKSNIEQSVGRILRKEHDIKPLIIDVKDDFAPFSNQFKKRKAYYKKCKYDIKEIVIESESYKKNIEDNKNIHNTTICKKIDFSEKIVIETKKKTNQNHLKECFIDSDED